MIGRQDLSHFRIPPAKGAASNRAAPSEVTKESTVRIRRCILHGFKPPKIAHLPE